MKLTEAGRQGLAPAALAGTSKVRVRILATSDLHAHVLPWDYHADRASASAGLARTASLIRQARAEMPGALLFDNGDFLNGAPVAEVPGLANPILAAMNALRYDAATLGNHEFSHGLAALGRALQVCRFPLVSSNMLLARGGDPGQDRHIVAPRLILDRPMTDDRGQERLLRIGLLGLAPPQVTQWDRAALGERMEVRDILEAAAHHAGLLRAEGAHLVVALCHSGIGDTEPRPMMENAAAALAGIAGIDVIIAGHTHQAFPGRSWPERPGIDARRGLVQGKPVVMPGFHGSHLGVIDLELRPMDAWQVADARVELRAIARRLDTGELQAQTVSDPEIMALAAPAHRVTRDWAAAVVGRSAVAIHSYFAMVAPAAAVRLVARAQAEHVRRALAGGPLADLPVVSVAAPFHCGGRGGPENYTHVPAGPLTRRHVFDLYPHPNAIAALKMTGAGLAEWLERAVSQFRQITPGAQDAPLLDPDFPAFNFDTIEGLSWEVDLSAPPRHDAQGRVVAPQARRIRNLCHAGRPLQADQTFILATNSYRATGSGGFPVGSADQLVLKGPAASRDVLAAHVASQAILPPEAAPSWRFCPMPATSVTFDTAPEAVACLAELARMRPEALEMTPEGFRRFRLQL